MFGPAGMYKKVRVGGEEREEKERVGNKGQRQVKKK